MDCNNNCPYTMPCGDCFACDEYPHCNNCPTETVCNECKNCFDCEVE